MAKFTDMLTEVAPHAAGAPEPMIVNAIRNAVIAFCDGAWCWQVDTDPMSVGANVQDYAIDSSVLPSGSAVAKILYGYYNGIQIDPITKEDLASEFPRWKTQTGNVPTRFFAGDVMTKVSLVPIPVANQVAQVSPNLAPGLFFTLALKPSRASTDFPDFIFERYIEDIAHGAISRLLAMPHKTWSNVTLALTHSAVFRDKIAEARRDSMKSFTRANPRNRVRGVASW